MPDFFSPFFYIVLDHIINKCLLKNQMVCMFFGNLFHRYHQIYHYQYHNGNFNYHHGYFFPSYAQNVVFDVQNIDGKVAQTFFMIYIILNDVHYII